VKTTKGKFRMGWLGLIFLGSVMIFGCGGGGGGDDGGGGEVTPTPPTTTIVNYSINNPEPASSVQLLRATADGIAYTINSIGLKGTYNRITRETTLNDNTGIEFTVNPYRITGNPLQIGVLIPNGSTVRWVGQNNPTEGAFQVNPVGLAFNFIRVEVNNTLPGGAGVDIYVDGTFRSSLPWWDFIDAASDSQLDYEIVASIAYRVWQSFYRQAQQAYTALEIIVTKDDLLESSGTIQEMGTGFPAAGPKRMTIQWVDTNGGGLGPGDSFNCTFENWWVNEPTNDKDYIYDGLLQLIWYWRGQNAAGSFAGGNFNFTNFTSRETDSNTNQIDQTSTITFNGGFLLIVSWQ